MAIKITLNPNNDVLVPVKTLKEWSTEYLEKKQGTSKSFLEDLFGDKKIQDKIGEINNEIKKLDGKLAWFQKVFLKPWGGQVTKEANEIFDKLSKKNAFKDLQANAEVENKKLKDALNNVATAAQNLSTSLSDEFSPQVAALGKAFNALLNPATVTKESFVARYKLNKKLYEAGFIERSEYLASLIQTKTALLEAANTMNAIVDDALKKAQAANRPINNVQELINYMTEIGSSQKPSPNKYTERALTNAKQRAGYTIGAPASTASTVQPTDTGAATGASTATVQPEASTASTVQPTDTGAAVADPAAATGGATGADPAASAATVQSTATGAATGGDAGTTVQPAEATGGAGGAAKKDKYGKRDVKKSVADAQLVFDKAFENANKSAGSKGAKISRIEWKQELLNSLKNEIIGESLNVIEEQVGEDDKTEQEKNIDTELSSYGYTPEVTDSLWADYISTDSRNRDKIKTKGFPAGGAGATTGGDAGGATGATTGGATTGGAGVPLDETKKATIAGAITFLVGPDGNGQGEIGKLMQTISVVQNSFASTSKALIAESVNLSANQKQIIKNHIKQKIIREYPETTKEKLNEILETLAVLAIGGILQWALGKLINAFKGSGNKYPAGSYGGNYKYVPPEQTSKDLGALISALNGDGKLVTADGKPASILKDVLNTQKIQINGMVESINKSLISIAPGTFGITDSNFVDAYNQAIAGHNKIKTLATFLSQEFDKYETIMR